MLQVLIPGLRIGHQFKAGENLVQGTVAYVSGIHTDGYFLLKAPSTDITAAMAIYPFLKYSFREDLTDYGVATAGAGELIASGEPVVAFEGGEYITDRFVSKVSASVGVGTHTTSAFFFDAIQIDSATGTKYALTTDTAAYTEGAGKFVYLYPSTAAATKGYLRVATANDAGNPLSVFNKNFQLVKVWSRGPQGFAGNKVQFRVVGRDAFAGRYWSGVSTAAYYNVGIVNT